MRKFFLLALPLASLMLIAGCNESEYAGSSGISSPSPAQAAPQQQAAQPAPSYQSSRNSTTQPLPGGYGYMHEQDLTGGRLVTNSPAAPAPRGTGGS